DNLQKNTIADMLGLDKEVDDESTREPLRLGDALPGNVRRALTIRALTGSASINKLEGMEVSIAEDGRAHRLLQYHGTGPGRWAPRLWNILNFPRGTAVRADTHKPEHPDIL